MRPSPIASRRPLPEPFRQIAASDTARVTRRWCRLAQAVGGQDMKSLRDYTTLKGTITESGAGITWGTAFDPPIHATVNGLPVRVLTIGDLPGASDVFLCSDATGFMAPIKRTDIVVTDGAYLPLTKETPGNLEH